MQIDRAFIEREFNQFFEFDSEDRRTVTSVSCRLFAEHIAQRAAGQEREACKAAIESCVNKLGFGDGSPGRWMADRCLRAISERTKAPSDRWICLLCKSGIPGRHGTLDDRVTPCPNKAQK